MYLTKDSDPTYIKNAYKSIRKKERQPVEKGQETLNEPFTKEDLQMAYTCMKTLLVIEETQNKTTTRYHHTHTQIAKNKITGSIKFW